GLLSGLGGLGGGLILIGLLVHLIGHVLFLGGGLGELLLGGGERILGDVAQLFLHERIFRQLGLEFLEQRRRVFLRHLGEHLGVGKLLVQLVLHVELLLGLTQLGARLGE